MRIFARVPEETVFPHMHRDLGRRQTGHAFFLSIFFGVVAGLCVFILFTMARTVSHPVVRPARTAAALLRPGPAPFPRAASPECGRTAFPAGKLSPASW